MNISLSSVTLIYCRNDMEPLTLHLLVSEHFNRIFYHSQENGRKIQYQRLIGQFNDHSFFRQVYFLE